MYPDNRSIRCRPLRSPLKPSAFIALPLKAIAPEGWLKRQLRIQADGLTGHLDEFWPDVGPQCGWLGGPGESWERGPYYLDGLLPLAHLLGDEKLLKKANERIEWAIQSQQPNGQFGPPTNDDWWPRMIMCKALAMHYEATGDPRVPPMLSRYFRYQLAELPKHPLKEWAVPRGGDNILVVHWLYNLTGEQFLLDLAKVLFEQTDPWWKVQGAFPGQIPPGFAHTPLTMLTHGVNNAMGLKTAAVMYSQTGEEHLRNATRWGLQNLMRITGSPTACFATDEHLNGTSPTAGCELCAVCEMMFSLEEVFRLEGDSALCRPARTHCPQRASRRLSPRICGRINTTNRRTRSWFRSRKESGRTISTTRISTAWSRTSAAAPRTCIRLGRNSSRAWPWRPYGGGLAIVAYGPCSVRAQVAGGARLEMIEETDYPFDGKVRLKLKLEKPARLPARRCTFPSGPAGHNGAGQR